VVFRLLASAEMPRVQAPLYHLGLADLRQLAIESTQEALARSRARAARAHRQAGDCRPFGRCLAHCGAGFVALYSIKDASPVLVVAAIRSRSAAASPVEVAAAACTAHEV